MPNFLSKLFRRKGGSSGDHATSSSGKTKRGRGSHRIRSKSSKEKAVEHPSQPSPQVLQPKKDNQLNRTPTATTMASDRVSSGSGVIVSSGTRAAQQQQHGHGSSAGGMSSPRNANGAMSVGHHSADGSSSSTGKQRRTSAGPVDLDDTDMEESDAENRQANVHSPRLSFHQLQQFNRQPHQSQQQQQQQHSAHHLYVHSPTRDHRNNNMDHSLDHGSDASSSDFNLSTDAEDTEYNNLRRRGGAPPPPPAMVHPYDNGGTNNSHLDTSGLSAMSSPTNYTTDDETNAIFPALPQTDDEGTTISPTTKEQQQQQQLTHEQHSSSSLHPDDEGASSAGGGGLRIMPMAHETEDDMRAWTISPTSASASDANSNHKSKQQATSPKFNSFSKKKELSTTSTSTPKVVQVERAPQSITASNKDAFKDTFGNFANFDDVFPMDQRPRSTRSNNSTNNKTRAFLVEAPHQSPDGFGSSRPHRTSSSASASQQETSLSDLLAQAKRKSSRSSRRGSSSVNSAPVITSQYLRETHKLGGSHSHKRSSNDSRSVDKTTSVSDIIQSLEATNASRIKTSRSGSRSHGRGSGRGDFDSHSHASNGGTSTRSAKERLREKRRLERNARNNNLGSDDSDDNEEAESWLFDEVTGALGPRGVAADMESLGGRSKNSTGNKSHRSHRSHKSHRSHRSSRRKKSSSESVDSRNSRNSRYSHRSTRSYLSQMSEQSRSVANDLLRLEMQLAMVGSQDVNDETSGTGKGNSGSVAGSTGGASRASRTSRTSRTASSARRTGSVSKRSKMTVIAPPGKLGIILANKADSKGTVVSGVRTSSVLAEKISPGDRIIAIDGEDVSLMTVSEITTIMARKSDFERQLTIMTTPKHLGLTSQSRGDYGEADGYYRR